MRNFTLKIFNPNKTHEVLPSPKDFTAQVKKLSERTDVGFINLGKNHAYLNECINLKQKYFVPKFFIHVGIGGSSLGPQMLIDALGSKDVKFIFVNNIDPDQIRFDLIDIDPNECLFYFVSKSGTTAETLAHLAILSNWAREKKPSFDFSKHFIFCTDPEKGDLRKMAKELHIGCLPVPSNIGGRFSVLTAVGLFPSLYSGIDAESLLEGANEMSKIALSPSETNPIWKALKSLLQWKHHGVNQTVLMPYSSRLKSFSDWFVQLWAESLGKKLNLSNREIYEGLTPIRAYGATDQHSQIQLFMEGPLDKSLIIIKIGKFDFDFKLKGQFSSASGDKLNYFKLSNLMEAELEGTLKALEAADRPHLTIEIDTLDAFNLGQLIMFFEILTATMGHYLGIDPFNQPGVEAGKKYAFEWLKKLADKNI